MAFNVTRDADFDARTITVREAVAYVSNQPIIKRPKTDAGLRTVPMFELLINELCDIKGYAAKRKRSDGIMSESAFSSAWASYILAVECYINGYTHKRWYGNTAADKAILSAGGQLAPWKTFDIRPHDLRHSFCTMLRDAGVDLHIAVEWMGHEDEKMILEIYDHVSDERRQKAIKMVENNMPRGQNGGQK